MNKFLCNLKNISKVHLPTSMNTFYFGLIPIYNMSDKSVNPDYKSLCETHFVALSNASENLKHATKS